ncbi:hypothetical protein GCM10007414_14870 [Agarivorans gilvus]|uniref:DUF3592 domain-containing protein n=2 Tax=Agarivorans gilvus TaxID=680279 RepID=A0ABQ1I0X3_9ALTE|nr:hypothetical protein GCM10007414_14870 [Agarivorans gilvus]
MVMLSLLKILKFKARSGFLSKDCEVRHIAGEVIENSYNATLYTDHDPSTNKSKTTAFRRTVLKVRDRESGEVFIAAFSQRTEIRPGDQVRLFYYPLNNKDGTFIPFALYRHSDGYFLVDKDTKTKASMGMAGYGALGRTFSKLVRLFEYALAFFVLAYVYSFLSTYGSDVSEGFRFYEEPFKAFLWAISEHVLNIPDGSLNSGLIFAAVGTVVGVYLIEQFTDLFLPSVVTGKRVFRRFKKEVPRIA